MGTPKPRLSREETALIDPPRKNLQPHEIKVQMYLRECRKLQVIPVGAYLRQPIQNALIIRHYNMGPNGARALAAPLMLDQVLSFLDIEGNSISPVGLASIQEALSENIHITQLNIADNKLGTRGAELIGRLMSTNATIERLNVARNGFRDSDAPIFAKIIKSNRHLRELILAGNEFADIAGREFGHALSNSETLEVFDVSWNHLRKQSAAEFSQGIKFQKSTVYKSAPVWEYSDICQARFQWENVGLKTLNVSFNGFGHEGTCAMAQALAHNTTLHDLDMSKNRITDIGVIMLTKQLKHNEGLRILRLGDNLLTSAAATDLIKTVLGIETTSLELIDLGSTGVDLLFMTILDELTAAKNIKVIFGKIQKIGDIKPPKEAAYSEQQGDFDEFTEVGTEYTGEELDTERDRTKTYILDDEENQVNNDETVEGEVETVKEQIPQQIPVYAESTGTLTPDI